MVIMVSISCADRKDYVEYCMKTDGSNEHMFQITIYWIKTILLIYTLLRGSLLLSISASSIQISLPFKSFRESIFN